MASHTTGHGTCRLVHIQPTATAALHTPHISAQPARARRLQQGLLLSRRAGRLARRGQGGPHLDQPGEPWQAAVLCFPHSRCRHGADLPGNQPLIACTLVRTAAQAVTRADPDWRSATRRLRRERSLHEGLLHRHVVRLLAAAEDGANAYLVLEHCSEWLGAARRVRVCQRRRAEHPLKAFARARTRTHAHTNAHVHRRRASGRRGAPLGAPQRGAGCARRAAGAGGG